MSIEPGIDVGSYTPNVTIERMECVQREYGIEWASVGLQGNPYLNGQIETSCAADLNVDTYLIPRSWYMDPVPLISRQLERIAQYKGQISEYVWFDVETLPGEDPPPEIVLPWTRTALSLIDAAGWKASIYTSASMWSALTADSVEFRQRPMWEANYGRYRPYREFGGWDKRTGVQIAGSTTLCELNVDLSMWELREQTMTDEQIKALIGECLAQEARLGAKVDLVRTEQLVQGYLLATNRDADAKTRIEFEAVAGGVTLP